MTCFNRSAAYEQSLQSAGRYFGDATARMTRAVFSEGVDRAVLLMRHSAREYRRDIHDLENPLTQEGRELAARFGARYRTLICAGIPVR